jgi:hypothetical protein
MRNKEKIYFGLMMCTGMVVFMTFYNLATHGLFGSVSALEIIVQVAAAFVVSILHGNQCGCRLIHLRTALSVIRIKKEWENGSNVLPFLFSRMEPQ